MNKEWHRQNKMPKKATLQERLNWHLEHQRHCDCRPMPENLAALVAQRRQGGKTRDKAE
jgi:hypothetical protein